MSCSFYIVDDDRSVRKMLAHIIQTRYDDAFIQQNDSPWMAVQDLLKLPADIVLLDLLMEDMDGIEAAQKLREGKFPGRIIMLSEVTDKEMVEKAYEAGVDDYISKPINVTEVQKVISRNLEHLQLRSYVRLMGSPAQALPPSSAADASKAKAKISSLYKELGIIGEPGTEELSFWCLAQLEGRFPQRGTDLNLSDLYHWLKENYPPFAGNQMGVKGIEQRLRRLVITVMENLAHMGVEDFSSFKFERYSTALFNFKVIKLEMDYLRGNSNIRGKVDVKRFIDGFISLIE